MKIKRNERDITKLKSHLEQKESWNANKYGAFDTRDDRHIAYTYPVRDLLMLWIQPLKQLIYLVLFTLRNGLSREGCELEAQPPRFNEIIRKKKKDERCGMVRAELYSSANGMQRRDAEEVITEFCGKLKWTENARVLDIGCGTGEVTAAILLPQMPSDFEQLVGLDVSPEMIQYARKAYSHPKVSFVEFDIAHETENILEELNVKLENNNVEMGKIKILVNDREMLDKEKYLLKQGYDIVLSFYCLHWIHNQRLALGNIHKLLKPGGDALLVLLAKAPIFSLYDRLSSLPLWKEYMQDVENFISPYHRSEDPLHDFLDLVNEIGFDTIKSECRERNYVFQGTSSLRNAINAVNPFISRIPNHLHGQFISDCLKEVEELKLTKLKNNCHKVTYKLLVAHIRRSK